MTPDRSKVREFSERFDPSSAWDQEESPKRGSQKGEGFGGASTPIAVELLPVREGELATIHSWGDKRLFRRRRRVSLPEPGNRGI
jgi:hypothetical protein